MGFVIALASHRPNAQATEALVDIDIHIGRRIRRRRRLLGLSQAALGEACGVSFQQIQKFECASTRVTAVRLWLVAEALQAPVSYFYEGLTRAQREHLKAQGEAPTAESLASAETLELVRAYNQMGEVARRRLLEMARAMYDPMDVTA
jgi:transcriptional regulator with XRE-family HTH domain